MAKLSSDKTYVTVEKGDTLSGIAQTYLGSASKYKQLASINGISNPNLIYINQKIYLQKTSGGSSGGSSTKKTSSNKATITHFGLQSNADNVLFAVWTWDHTKNYKAKSTKSHTTTENYSYQWYYTTGDGVWFVGTKSTTTDKQCTYSIPSNAKRVRFRVKPISKTFTKNKKETSYFTAEWTSYKEFNISSIPPDAPGTPSVEIERYKLTVELDNISVNATKIEFQIVKNDKTVFKTGTANIKTKHASYSCTVAAGSEYKVRCRAIRDKLKSKWSEYSSNVTTVPSAPGSILKIKALSETEVQLDWENVKNATSYVIEYTTKKRYFDSSNEVSSMTVDAKAAGHAEVTGLTSGEEYFFRVKATNSQGDSGWCPIKSIIIGKAPEAPTTWSSTTTAIINEPLKLYWVHNSEDGSSLTSSYFELKINGEKDPRCYTLGTKEIDDGIIHYTPLSTEEREKGKTNVCEIYTSASEFSDGAKIKWHVKTAGILKDSKGNPKYGDWSILRVVDIYAPPELELAITNQNGESIETLESFPLYIKATAGPNTQKPIGYHLNIVSRSTYDTVDNVGNKQTIDTGDSVYSKYFDTTGKLNVKLTAGNIDLANDASYEVICTVSMNSGLTDEVFQEFTVSWSETKYEPNAEISIDEDAATAHIRPYCESGELKNYKVSVSSGIYTRTTDIIEDFIYGVEVNGVTTTTGEQVYSGVTVDGEDVYYCEVKDTSLIQDVLLSVYRREYDGSFTEIATGVRNNSYTTVTDPHPSLDYARYRIVATEKSTGAVSYYDVPGYPVNEKSAIIQWDEAWASFDTTEEDELEEPAWSGSMIKIPYNIDISDSNDKDVELIEYIGREHPVSYYGTQLGTKSDWNMEIPADDKDTLYALRRLQKWMGDVYVREPSGSGYWANISVSFSKTHCEVTIPVSFSITRVEGGI